MREPYVPLALFLFAYLLWKPASKLKLISAGVFFAISFLTLATLPLKDFYFNVVTFNLYEIVGNEVSKNTFFGVDVFKIVFYPFYILFPVGQFGYYRQILIFESLLFILLLVYNLKKLEWKMLIYIFLALALANIRFTEPGVAFYSAFHMNVWYSLFVFSLVFLISLVKSSQKFMIGMGIFIGIFLYSIWKDSIIWQKIDQQEQLLTNYGQQMLYIQILEKLSDPSDTLFLDGWDELIYSQAKLPSSYKYSHFTSLMPNIKMYQDARLTMFNSNPPIFYYGTCREDVGQKLPKFIRSSYVRVNHMGKPTCLYVLREKYEKIKQEGKDTIDPQISFNDEQE